MIKKIKINIDIDKIDFLIFGISYSDTQYKLAHFLNQQFKINLFSHSIDIKNKTDEFCKTSPYFYQYHNNDEKYFLIPNFIYNDYLYKKIKHINQLFLVQTETDEAIEESAYKIINIVKKIPNIIQCVNLDPKSFKQSNIQNILEIIKLQHYEPKQNKNNSNDWTLF